MNNLMEKYNRAIAEFHEANRRVAEASLAFSAVFRPAATDLSKIAPLYEKYTALAREKEFRADGQRNDKQFVFAVLHLYSPASLCGGIISRKVRRAVAESLGIKADTAIYKMRSIAVSWYGTYPLFRSECNIAIQAFCEALGLADMQN